MNEEALKRKERLKKLREKSNKLSEDDDNESSDHVEKEKLPRYRNLLKNCLQNVNSYVNVENIWTAP